MSELDQRLVRDLARKVALIAVHDTVHTDQWITSVIGSAFGDGDLDARVEYHAAIARRLSTVDVTWPPERNMCLPCPKCGSADTSLTYCDGCDLIPHTSLIGNHADDKCRHGDAEHNHRACRMCSYRWRTDDVTDARKVCVK